MVIPASVTDRLVERQAHGTPKESPTLAGSRNRHIVFAVLWTGAFGLTTLAAFLGQTQLDRVVSYTLPLAGILFPLIGLVTVAGGRVSVLKW